MKRLSWKKDAVYSIRLKGDLYTIVQMLDNYYMLFFEVFHHSDKWENINLNKENILFCVPVIPTAIKHRIERDVSKEVIIRDNYVLPIHWLSPLDMPWEERKKKGINYPYKGAKLVEIDPKVGDRGMDNKVIKSNLNWEKDRQIIDRHEFAMMNTLTLIERLIICYHAGENVEPMKYKVFLGIDPYKVYEYPKEPDIRENIWEMRNKEFLLNEKDQML